MNNEAVYNPEELKAICAKMSEASKKFYGMATMTGCHPFIEITGFMNEYIKICSQAADEGIDFTQANVHSGQALPVKPWEAAYLGEKFGCMFDTSLGRDPAMLAAFLLGAFEPGTVYAMAELLLKKQEQSHEQRDTDLA